MNVHLCMIMKVTRIIGKIYFLHVVLLWNFFTVLNI